MKIRNKKTGQVIEVKEKDLHKYGLGGKIKKADNGVITTQPTDSNMNWNTGNLYNQSQINPAKTFYNQYGNQQIDENYTPQLSPIDTDTPYNPNNDIDQLNQISPITGNYIVNQPDYIDINKTKNNQNTNFKYNPNINLSTIGGNGYIAKGIANLGTGIVNIGKGVLDDIGSFNQNKMAQKQEQNQYTQSIVNQAENVRPYEINGFKRSGRNPLFADGGTTSSDFQVNSNQANIEAEQGEHMLLPNGFSDQIKGKPHEQGGTPMLLPIDTKIFSEKLKEPVTDKSYSKLAKKFETKKNFELLDSKHADPIQKRTAEMMISKKNEKLNDLFEVQELNKLAGEHGKEVKLEAIQNLPMAKYGKKVMSPGGTYLPLSNEEVNTQIKEGKYANEGTLNEAINWFENKHGVKLPSNLTKNQKLKLARSYQNITNPELSLDYKLNYTRGNLDSYNEYKNSKGYKKGKDDVEESENFKNWSIKNGKILGDYEDRGKWGHEFLRTEKLPFTKEEFLNSEGKAKDKDWEKVGNYWIDRGVNPEDPIIYYKEDWDNSSPNPKVKLSENTPTNNFVNNNLTQEGINKIDLPPINIGVGLPSIYGRTPLNYYKTNPNYIDPRYLDIEPQLNEIARAKNTFRSNLGDRSNTSISNLLQSQANAYNQEQQVFNTKYNYDRQQDAQTQQFNAQAKTQNDQYNQQSWFQQLEDPIRRREGAIDTQIRTDRNKGIENYQKAERFANTKDFIDKTYYPWQNEDVSLGDLTALSTLDQEKKRLYDKKIIEEYERNNKGQVVKKEIEKSKNGGKIKLKPKYKK